MTLYLFAVSLMIFCRLLPSVPHSTFTLSWSTIRSVILLAWSGLDAWSALISSMSFFLPSTMIPPRLLTSCTAQAAEVSRSVPPARRVRKRGDDRDLDRVAGRNDRVGRIEVRHVGHVLEVEARVRHGLREGHRRQEEQGECEGDETANDTFHSGSPCRVSENSSTKCGSRLAAVSRQRLWGKA